MAAIIVTIICLVMTVVGGMTLSQGILTSADSTVINVDKISVREGEMTRTDLDILRVTPLTWTKSREDYLRVTVKNSGQVKLASFDKWDVIMNYTDSGGTLHSTWLPYSDVAPADNEWQKARLGLEGPIEFFEPGILNPGEEMVALIHLNPLAGNTASGDVSLATPNGVYDSMSFSDPGYLRLTAQSENITIANTKYYELVEAATADGPAMNVRADFGGGEVARKLLYNGTRPSQFIYPLIGITSIPAAQWRVYYRVRVESGFLSGIERVYFNTDIKIISSNGTVKWIDTRCAEVSISRTQQGSWRTLNATYNFANYNVVDQNDYLEIDFYAETKIQDDVDGGYVQLRIDDGSLALANQTRIRA